MATTAVLSASSPTRIVPAVPTTDTEPLEAVTGAPPSTRTSRAEAIVTVVAASSGTAESDTPLTPVVASGVSTGELVVRSSSAASDVTPASATTRSSTAVRTTPVADTGEAERRRSRPACSSATPVPAIIGERVSVTSRAAEIATPVPAEVVSVARMSTPADTHTASAAVTAMLSPSSPSTTLPVVPVTVTVPA